MAVTRKDQAGMDAENLAKAQRAIEHAKRSKDPIKAGYAELLDSALADLRWSAQVLTTFYETYPQLQQGSARGVPRRKRKLYEQVVELAAANSAQGSRLFEKLTGFKPLTLEELQAE